MKPTFEVYFGGQVPHKPGLWLVRRDGYIAVMDIEASDIERHTRQGNWLDGDYGGLLVEVPADIVPLSAKMTKAYLDARIAEHAQTPELAELFQSMRVHFFGARFERSAMAAVDADDHPPQCASASPDSERRCTMAVGHLGPHKIGNVFSPVECWVTPCSPCKDYHPNSSAQLGLTWKECPTCGDKKDFKVTTSPCKTN